MSNNVQVTSRRVQIFKKPVALTNKELNDMFRGERTPVALAMMDVYQYIHNSMYPGDEFQIGIDYKENSTKEPSKLIIYGRKEFSEDDVVPLVELDTFRVGYRISQSPRFDGQGIDIHIEFYDAQRMNRRDDSPVRRAGQSQGRRNSDRSPSPQRYNSRDRGYDRRDLHSEDEGEFIEREPSAPPPPSRRSSSRTRYASHMPPPPRQGSVPEFYNDPRASVPKARRVTKTVKLTTGEVEQMNNELKKHGQKLVPVEPPPVKKGFLSGIFS